MGLKLMVSFEGVVLITPIELKLLVLLEEFGCYRMIQSMWKLF